MTIDELIARLEEYRDEIGGDAEVRLMTQQNWPFENSIYGLASGAEINDYQDDEDGDDVPTKACELCVNAKRKPQRKHGEMTMTTADKKANEKILRDAFRTMDPHQAQEIRESYYKAIEGIHALAELLEIADAQQPQTAGPLLTEHLLACEAIDAMKKSLLGKIL